MVQLQYTEYLFHNNTPQVSEMSLKQTQSKRKVYIL